MTPESNTPSVDPNIVGNAFVQNYYTLLYESPAEVRRFYLEDSVLGRPNLNGGMVFYKSLTAINDQIMSFDCQNSEMQILTADSQASLKNVILTLVTGLIGKDGERNKFSQSFVLVPQKGSYFVLNDIFRYVPDEFIESEATKEVEESPQVIESTDIVTERADDTLEAVIIRSQAETVGTKPASAIANGLAEVPKEKVVNGNSNLPEAAEAKLQKPASVIVNGHVEVPKEIIVNGNSKLPKAAEAEVQEDSSKRSYAGIVKSLAQNGGQFSVKASSAKPKRLEKIPVAPEPKASESKAPVPISEQTPAKTVEQRAKGGTIFVANLPLDATPEQLYETFKGFGAVRTNGIQVRSYMEKRNCFGFVAFENGEAVKNVLQAHKESAIRIGNRRVNIEEKKANNNGNGGKASGRNNGNYRNENGFRNDGHRPRGNSLNGGRGYGKHTSEADADGKAYQNNGHGNAQARN